MTLRIKQEIEARQRVFTIGNTLNYKQLCTKVSALISKAKADYYQLKAEGIRKPNPAK